MSDDVQMDHEYVICPHCGEQHGDCWEWVDERPALEECQNPECGKKFIAWAEHDVTYHAKKAPPEKTSPEPSQDILG